ncbi:hypothetical protein FG386_000856 [Cryptosporidium ryanae]|uniref:uncharacterized protein n=1 Tax=Cryptosporidium ryanae TaxID=515981 RepID=UPI003519F4E1|nr:hypothetical protein FG386_000856 [Cryptosporidium ryanae]
MSSELVDWAQCELCKKWRKLPPGLNPSTLPDEWVCSMNTWDPFFSSCSASEEIVLNPIDSINSNTSDNLKSFLDNQVRTVKGRKRNVNSLYTNNLAGLQENSVKIHNLVVKDDHLKNIQNNLYLGNFFSKRIFSELKDWGDGIKNLQPSKEGHFEFIYRENENLPSCWPHNYRDIDDVHLFRNKTFEQFEKNKIKVNQNWAKTQDSASILSILQNYPVCIFRTKTPNLRDHPLFGRTIISGSEISVAYERVCYSSVKILPALTNGQMFKNSGNVNSSIYYCNNIYSAQKNQNSASSSSSSVSIEFIPAIKSDWNLSYLDLSNSLFAEDNSLGGNNQIDSWKSCSSSYNKLYSFDYKYEETPFYLSTCFRESYQNRESELATIDDRNNVDILDLLPLFSWIENYSKGIDDLYLKLVQQNLSYTHTSKDSKKQSTSKNITRNKTKNQDTDNLYAQIKIRRSSRTAQKAQSNEQISFDTKDISSDEKNNVKELQEADNSFVTAITINSDCSPEVVENVSEDIVGSHEVTDNEKTNIRSILNTVLGDSLNLQLVSDNNDLKNNSEEKEADFDNNSSNCSMLLAQEDLENKDNTPCSEKIPDISFECVGDYERVDLKIGVNLCPENTSSENIEDKLIGTDKNTCNNDRNYDISEGISLYRSETFDDDDNILIKSSMRRKLKKRSRTFDNCILMVSKKSTTDDLKVKIDGEQNKEKKTIEESNNDNYEEQQNSSSNQNISNIQVIPKKKTTEVIDRISAGSSRGDPWIPISDNNNKFEAGPVEELFQNQYHKAKNLTWKGEQRRQKSLEQKRSYYCSGRASYSQHKYHTPSKYDAYEVNQYMYRNNANEMWNHNSNTKKHYFNSNINTSIQNSSKNEDSYNYRNYYYSKYNDLSGISNNANQINRSNHRSRLNDY